MIRVLEYAQIAGHVYDPTADNYIGLNIDKIEVDQVKNPKKKSGWSIITKISPRMNIENPNPYFAALYIKYQSGRATDAVVSVRGTEPTEIDNLWVDAKSWGSDVIGTGEHVRIPDYFGDILQFVAQCKKLLAKNFSCVPLRITGHSLGGALAQLIALIAYPIPAIVFNSPGCGQMPGIDKTRVGLIHNINSKYGFINKIGVTLGEVFIIDVPEDREIARKVMEKFSTTLSEMSTFQLPDDMPLIPLNKIDTDGMDGVQLAASSAINIDVTVKEYVLTHLFNVAYETTGTLKKMKHQISVSIPDPSVMTNYAAHPKFWEASKVICTAAPLCAFFYYYTVLKAVYEQHGMINMVKTLQMDKYSSLANRTF